MDEPTYVDSPEVFQNAAIGHVRMIAESDPIPVNWRECDGATLISSQWPLFVQELGVQAPTFTVPKPARALNGYRFIVKMGEELPVQEPKPPYTSSYPSPAETARARARDRRATDG